jgi:hypothetical protein
VELEDDEELELEDELELPLSCFLFNTSVGTFMM